jgi:hypothetical protein
LYFLQYEQVKPTWSEKMLKRIERLSTQYKWENKKVWKLSDSKWIEVSVPSERYEIIAYANELGHFGLKGTMDRIQERYYWNNMREEIVEFIDNCTTCLRNSKRGNLETEAKSLIESGLFDRIGIDLVFGLPVTKEGYHGVLVITEYLSRYPFVIPIRSKEAEEVACGLWRYISIFGPPKEILYDQGKEFVNAVIDRMCKSMRVNRRITSAN